MLTENQAAKFQHDGFLNGGCVLNEGELAELTEELDRVLAIGPTGFRDDQPKPVLFRDLTARPYDGTKAAAAVSSRPVWQIVNIWEASSAFRRLLHHPSIVEAIHQLTDFADLQVWHDQVQYKPANMGGATSWHQDAPAWPSIEPMTPVSAWLPLDDADIENGCMWMVPGSHTWGNQVEYLGPLHTIKTLPAFSGIGADFLVPPESAVREVRTVPCPVKRGEVHFHHSLTWHGSPENHSPRPRRAIAIHYMSSAARYTGRAHPMQPFIQVGVGEPMLGAGPHFPVVCRAGRPVPAPE